MMNPNSIVRQRIRFCLVAGLLISSVGCGWTHGRYQSDPMLGNFNRPIAATPPIFTGGDPGVSPAYDTGVRLGLASPDVPSPQKNTDEHFFILPTYQGGLGIGNMFRGGGGSSGSPGRINTPAPTGGSGGGALFNRSSTVPGGVGARLPLLDTETDRSSTFVAGMVTPLPGSAVAAGRPRDVNAVLTNGSSIAADMPKPKSDPVKEALSNPQRIATIEEAHSLLTTCGAKTQALEQAPTGEWRFVCTMGDGSEYRRYEAKHKEPIEAVRAVLVQVHSEK